MKSKAAEVRQEPPRIGAVASIVFEAIRRSADYEHEQSGRNKPPEEQRRISETIFRMLTELMTVALTDPERWVTWPKTEQPAEWDIVVAILAELGYVELCAEADVPLSTVRAGQYLVSKMTEAGVTADQLKRYGQEPGSASDAVEASVVEGVDQANDDATEAKAKGEALRNSHSIDWRHPHPSMPVQVCLAEARKFVHEAEQFKPFHGGSLSYASIDVVVCNAIKRFAEDQVTWVLLRDEDRHDEALQHLLRLLSLPGKPIVEVRRGDTEHPEAAGPISAFRAGKVVKAWIAEGRFSATDIDFDELGAEHGGGHAASAASDQTPDQEGLDHSRMLDVHRSSDYPEVNEFVDRIYEEHFKGRKVEIRKRHVKVVLLDLYVAWADDPLLKIAYSRNVDDYEAGSRYNELHISKLTIEVVDALVEAGLLNHAKGFKDRETGVGRVSRMWPTEKLIAMFKDARFGQFRH